MSKSKIGTYLRSLFSFSQGEKRGVLWLLPMLAIVAVLVAVANRPRFETSFLELSDQIVSKPKPEAGTSSALQIAGEAPATETGSELFFFDPNTATLQEFCSLGIDIRTAAGIIKYRQRGKRFEIPEDFAACYGITIEMYTELEPYIHIDERFRLPAKASATSVSSNPGLFEATPVELTEFDPNSATAEQFIGMGFSQRQAAVIINFRQSSGGFRTVEDFARCYVVSDEIFEKLSPYIRIESSQQSLQPDSVAQQAGVPMAIELNTADSATLRSVSGIGEVLVGRIMDYRTRLGGFARVEQLAEVAGMSEANYERIVTQIWVDSCEIQKIDVNFAPHKTLHQRLLRHPYMTDRLLRKILKERQLKGGWSSIEDMVSQNIITRGQAEKLAPYLVFIEPK